MRGGVTGSSPVVSIAQYVDITNSKRRAQIGSEWRLRPADSEAPTLYDNKGKLH